MSQNGVSDRMLGTSASGVGAAGSAASGGGGSLGLLDHNHNHNHTTHSSGSMNHISSSQSAAASWSHSHVGSNQIVNGGLAISHSQSHSQQQQRGAAGVDYEAATAVMAVSAGVGVAPQSPQSSSSSQTGTSLKEHDLLGLSEVSSSTTNNNQRLETNSVQHSGAFDPNQSDEEINLNLNLGSGSSGRGGGLVDEGHGADQGPPPCPGDRRSATIDQSAPNQQQVSDRNCGYSAFGKGFPVSRAAAADVTESTRRGPSMIEGESLQKWHSGGVMVDMDSGKFSSNDGSRLNLTSLQQQQQQQARKGGGSCVIMNQQEDGSEKKQLFLGPLSLERFGQETGYAAQSGRQRLVSEENIHQYHHRPLAYPESRPSWREPQQQQQQPVGHRQEDVSSAERVGLGMGVGMRMRMGMGNQDMQQIVDQQQQEQERVGHEAFQVEKRNLPEGGGGEALATPSAGRHLDYATTTHSKRWQSPVPRSAVDVHASQQPHPHPHHSQQQQDEIARGVFASGQLGGGGPFPPASGMMFAHPPGSSAKLGMTGAKRPFEITGMISEARNVNDGRGGAAGLPNPAAVVGNSSAITSNSSSIDHDTKFRTHQLQQQQVAPPPYHHQSPWSSDSKLAGGAMPTATAHHPTWQMLHTGGSFGPFPYQAPGPARNASMPPMEVAAPAAAVAARAPSACSGGADPAHKSWEAHPNTITKGHHHQDTTAATSSCSTVQKQQQQSQLPIPAEAKAPGGVASPVPSPSTEAASPPRAAPAAVGWPPIRPFRKGIGRPSPVETNKPLNYVTAPPPPAAAAAAPPTPPPQAASPVSVASHPNASFVKVYMDGVPIGRKVDLKANCSYEKLSLILEDYFRGYVTGQTGGQSSRDGGVALLPSDKRRFLHGSDYVLTYEDQEGDLMLVGDVPWTLFIDNVKRLRIMKGSEAIGLGARAAEKVNKVQPTV